MIYVQIAFTIALFVPVFAVQGQSPLGQPEIPDAERARAVTERGYEALTSAEGIRYEISTSTIAEPADPAVWDTTNVSSFVAGGGRFRFHEPAMVVVYDGDWLHIASLSDGRYFKEPVESAEELRFVVYRVIPEAQLNIWLGEWGIDPAFDFVDEGWLEGTEFLGVTEETRDGRDGVWVYAREDGETAVTRTWHDSDTGLPERWESDVTETFSDYLPEGVLGHRTEHVLGISELRSVELLDVAPDEAVFAFDPESLRRVYTPRPVEDDGEEPPF